MLPEPRFPGDLSDQLKYIARFCELKGMIEHGTATPELVAQEFGRRRETPEEFKARLLAYKARRPNLDFGRRRRR